MNYSEITYPDVNNGVGCRVTLWVSGCNIHCPYCQNPQTWDFNAGNEFTEDVKLKLFNILSKPYIQGITLSGGNPLDNYGDILELLQEIKSMFGNKKDVWLYSGYTLEEIISKDMVEMLEYIDVLVDGPYIHELRDISLPFRGSSNQRILYKGEDF